MVSALWKVLGEAAGNGSMFRDPSVWEQVVEHDEEEDTVFGPAAAEDEEDLTSFLMMNGGIREQFCPLRGAVAVA